MSITHVKFNQHKQFILFVYTLNLLENFDNFLTISPDNPRKLIEAIELVIQDKLYEKNSDKNKKKIRDSFIREDHLGSCLDNIYEKQFFSA